MSLIGGYVGDSFLKGIGMGNNSWQYAMVQGAVSGATSGGINAMINDTKLSRGILQGMASGAATGAVMWGIQRSVSNRTTQETNTQKDLKSTNQVSIDKIKNLPALGDREKIYQQGFKEAERLGFIPDDAKSKIRTHLDTILLSDGNGTYHEYTDAGKAIDFLKNNPNFYATDGTHTTGGIFAPHRIRIYATATSPNTWLRNTGDLVAFRAQGNNFKLPMTSVENVIQTLAHEAGHHIGLDDNVRMWNREFDAIKRYRGL